MNETEKITPFTLADFTYALPPERIAQTPSDDRQTARLLHRLSSGEIHHHHVTDLAKLLPRHSLIVVNNSRVIAARLQGHFPGGGRGEVFLLAKPQGDSPPAIIQCFAYPMRKFTPGKTIKFAAGLEASVVEKIGGEDLATPSSPMVEISFNCSGNELFAWMEQHGCIPLPPYIKRATPPLANDSFDSLRYQTIYAECAGSVAAPTAGLHFSSELLTALAAKEIKVVSVTLHVGAGTFLPVKCADLTQHHMHREMYQIPSTTLAEILAAKQSQRKIVLIGTTTLRCLESIYLLSTQQGSALTELADQWWPTELFIYPHHRGDRYHPWVGDALLTNFHQPESTLLMLVSALIGYDEIKATYQNALDNYFRFLSYGDTSLLELP